MNDYSHLRLHTARTSQALRRSHETDTATRPRPKVRRGLSALTRRAGLTARRAVRPDPVRAR